MVLGGKSQPLDVGRKKRFHTEAMRLAMGVRDGGCTAEGCDKPASMCHSHHDIAWSAGGSTNVKTGRLLCGPHHRRLHQPRRQGQLPPTHVSLRGTHEEAASRRVLDRASQGGQSASTRG